MEGFQGRILDLSRLLPGPYCSRILADMGAEVIKIEQPGGGDWMRYVPPLEDGESLLFRALNRGKKGMTLNLKSEEGQEAFLRLVETADVLLESFRPGVMERLGIPYPALAEVNPRLIYCALTGYGPDGPYRERAGHDLNYVGLAGLLDLTGHAQEPPAIPGAPIADLSGALWATVGILTALLAREQTGRGQRVDASLLGGALSCLSVAVVRQQGDQPVARGASDLTGGIVCYNVYPTRDGKYVTLAALEPPFWAAFCQTAGRPDLMEDAFAPAMPGEPVYETLCALFRERTREEWVELFEGVDACCEPVYTMGEALDSEPVRALGMVTFPGLLLPLQPTPQAGDHAPALGEHTDTLLSEVGYDEAEIDKLRIQGVI